jgi:hypothetical protein
MIYDVSIDGGRNVIRYRTRKGYDFFLQTRNKEHVQKFVPRICDNKRHEWFAMLCDVFNISCCAGVIFSY